jgi:hypothetical protein
MKKLYMIGNHRLPVITVTTSVTLLFFALLLLPSAGRAQTSPAAQSLPYSESFSTFTGSTTTYPPGWQGWTIVGSTATAYPSAAPNGDQALVAATNSSTSGRCGPAGCGTKMPGDTSRSPFIFAVSLFNKAKCFWIAGLRAKYLNFLSINLCALTGLSYLRPPIIFLT